LRGSSARIDAVDVDPLDPLDVAVRHQAQRAARRVLAAVAVVLERLEIAWGEGEGSSRTNLMKCSSPLLRTLAFGSIRRVLQQIVAKADRLTIVTSMA